MSINMPRTLKVVDSHTQGEPTRTVVEGVPDLGGGDMGSRLALLRHEADWVRTSLTLEPRGAPWMVGAVLQTPIDPACAAGVLFFNNAGYLGMCGHGLMGVVATLASLDRIRPGKHHFETPAGVVAAELDQTGAVSIENVPSFRSQKGVAVNLLGRGTVRGDIAYGGNWFFLVEREELQPTMIEELTDWTRQIRRQLQIQGLTGDNGEEIDHVEVVGPASDSAVADARNFVLCPGGHYDRSPCGTGTSAKLACLAADGKLAPGETWRQQSIIGSVFEASYQESADGVLPRVRGRAYVTGETTLILQPDDPFRHGIPEFTSGGFQRPGKG